MAFFSTKNYTPESGLSCCFRQHRAKHSHCSLLHGYALGFKFTFGCRTLDDKNWVQDFGGLKELKAWLVQTFDHKLVVSDDDPELDYITSLSRMGIADVLVLPAVGCEAFAEMAFEKAQSIVLDKNLHDSRVWVESVECYEHQGNSAIYTKG